MDCMAWRHILACTVQQLTGVDVCVSKQEVQLFYAAMLHHAVSRLDVDSVSNAVMPHCWNVLALLVYEGITLFAAAVHLQAADASWVCACLSTSRVPCHSLGNNDCTVAWVYTATVLAL